VANRDPIFETTSVKVNMTFLEIISIYQTFLLIKIREKIRKKEEKKDKKHKKGRVILSSPK
jgi:hypothetical protein